MHCREARQLLNAVGNGALVSRPEWITDACRKHMITESPYHR